MVTALLAAVGLFGFAPDQALAGRYDGQSKAVKPRPATSGVRGNNRVKHRVSPRSHRARISKSRANVKRPPTITADAAMKLVKSGQRVLLPTEAGASQMLLNALVKHSATLKGKKPVEVLHTASLIRDPVHGVMAQQNPKKLQVNALFINGGLRQYTGSLKITPTYLSEIPKLLDNKLKPDVVLVKVSPPDKQGYVSTGPSAGLVADLIADPKVKVIAEVNPNVPRTRGATRVHVSHLAAMVKGTEPMPELIWPKSTRVDKAIGRHVARHVQSGATLQLGIGPLQKTVAEALAARGKRLNSKGGKFQVKVRSEMIDDGLLAMAKAGILARGKDAVQLGFAVGSHKLYKFLEQDRRVKMVPTRDINDVAQAGARAKLTAVNSAVALDLYGQACSEMVPRKGPDGKVRPVPYSGVGGQVDFFRAVQRSRGGQGFLTLRSTAKGGALSTITLDLPQGLVVTTNRYDMDRVATEWGVTRSLRGLDVAERAQELIKVAHPKFRADLAKQGMDRFGGDPKAWNRAARVTQAELNQAKQFEAEGQ